ncbi:MAG: type II toxin-antitoxin system HicA family toxin [Candidatus Bathyarchaeia archaeon]|jgi:hypothetical protein
MTVLKANDVVRGLMKKGFRPDNRKHKFLFLYVNGKKTSVFTYVSWGSDDIDDYLIGKMSNQVRLERKEFINLVECPLSEEEYLAELTKKGELTE